MLVPLHCYTLGYTPFMLASLFLRCISRKKNFEILQNVLTQRSR